LPTPEDARLRQLLAPQQDAEGLGRVLGNGDIGGFQVQTLLDEVSYTAIHTLETFFSDRQRDDLLLVYFSGHGIKDTEGQLHFAAPNTRLDRLRSTAISAHLLNELMRTSHSRRQVLILDCCYSGAFARGMLTKADKTIGTGERFEGRGRVVLTASDAMQYSFEGTAVNGEAFRSIFTDSLVRGLETGEADRDGTGFISLDDLYAYVRERIAMETPDQRPERWAFGLEGDLVIARNLKPFVKPALLPIEVRQAIESSLTSVREGVVKDLERLLRGSHRGLSLAAHEALKQLAEDDSRRVSKLASDIIEARLTQMPRLATPEAHSPGVGGVHCGKPEAMTGTRTPDGAARELSAVESVADSLKLGTLDRTGRPADHPRQPSPSREIEVDRRAVGRPLRKQARPLARVLTGWRASFNRKSAVISGAVLGAGAAAMIGFNVGYWVSFRLISNDPERYSSTMFTMLLGADAFDEKRAIVSVALGGALSGFGITAIVRLLWRQVSITSLFVAFLSWASVWAPLPFFADFDYLGVLYFPSVAALLAGALWSLVIRKASVLKSLTGEPDSYLICGIVGTSYAAAWVVYLLFIYCVLSREIHWSPSPWFAFGLAQQFRDYSLTIPPFLFGAIGGAISLFFLDRGLRDRESS
jgi:hypothetical protein